jgi:hypothetical protein
VQPEAAVFKIKNCAALMCFWFVVAGALGGGGITKWVDELKIEVVYLLVGYF